MYNPANPTFSHIKWGLRVWGEGGGYSLHGLVNVLEN